MRGRATIGVKSCFLEGWLAPRGSIRGRATIEVKAYCLGVIECVPSFWAGLIEATLGQKGVLVVCVCVCLCFFCVCVCVCSVSITHLPDPKTEV